MDMTCPWQSAYPRGAKLPPNMTMVPIIESIDIVDSSVAAGIDALQRDDEINAQEGIADIERLAASRCADHRRIHRRVGGVGGVDRDARVTIVGKSRNLTARVQGTGSGGVA